MVHFRVLATHTLPSGFSLGPHALERRVIRSPWAKPVPSVCP